MYNLDLIEIIKDKLIWRQEIPDIELLAGLVAGSIPTLKIINEKFSDKEYLINTDVDISEYRVYAYVDELLLDGIDIELKNNEYGIWIKSKLDGYYDLYRFTRAEFVQGLISVSSNFNVDFRTIVKGVPFDYLGNKVRLYDYELNIDNYAVDVPDIDDIEEEERDNENVIELLIKDY